MTSAAVLCADRAYALEREFMDRVISRLGQARRFGLPGSEEVATGTARRDVGYPGDFGREVERLLRAAGGADSVLRARLPRGARARFTVRGGGLSLGRAVFVVAVSAVHPFDALIGGLRPGPLDPSQAPDWLPREPEGETPKVGVVFSSSGWQSGDEPPVWEGSPIVLFEPAEAGGFRPAGSSAEDLPEFLGLEDGAAQSVRVREYVLRSRVELVLHGLEVAKCAAACGVRADVVRETFEKVALEEEFVRLVDEGGTIVLRRADVHPGSNS